MCDRGSVEHNISLLQRQKCEIVAGMEIESTKLTSV